MNNYEAWRISFQSSEQAARSAYDQLVEYRELNEERVEAAYYRGQEDSRNGIHEVWQYEAFTEYELPDFETKPLCRIQYWADNGDMSVGIFPSSGIELSSDQSGTILANLKQERDELAAQVEVMRVPLEGAVEVLASMPSSGFAVLATIEAGREALSITPSAALREIQAMTLEEAAKAFEQEADAWEIAGELREMAAALRKGEE